MAMYYFVEDAKMAKAKAKAKKGGKKK